MAKKETESTIVTGLETANNPKEAEYDLVTSLLKAASFKTDEDLLTEAAIKRNGEFLFAVHLHPISDEDVRFARKKATVYMPNPNNKKLPPIEKESDVTKFKSWLIYLATTESDQAKIWGNPQVMSQCGLAEPWEGVGALLTAGEKDRLFELVGQISGMDEDGNFQETSPEDFREAADN